MTELCHQWLFCYARFYLRIYNEHHLSIWCYVHDAYSMKRSRENVWMLPFLHKLMLPGKKFTCIEQIHLYRMEHLRLNAASSVFLLSRSTKLLAFYLLQIFQKLWEIEQTLLFTSNRKPSNGTTANAVFHDIDLMSV